MASSPRSSVAASAAGSARTASPARMRTAPSSPADADALVEDDDAEHGRGERLGEHERRHLGGVEAAEAAREQRVRERGRDDAEIERESEPVGRVQPRRVAEQEHGEEEDGAEAERCSHHGDGGMAEPEQALRHDRVGRIAEAGDEREPDPGRRQRGVGCRREREHRDAGGGERGRDEPGASGPGAVEDTLEDARKDRPGADRDDRADGDARVGDGLEERELVDGDARRRRGERGRAAIVPGSHRTRAPSPRAGCRR